MVQKGKSFVISPNIKVVTQQIWKIMFAGLNYCESFFFRSRIASFLGGQLSTEEGYGVLSQVIILLGQYHANTTAGCICLETEGTVIAWWSKDCITTQTVVQCLE